MVAVIREPVTALRKMYEEDLPGVLLVEHAAYATPWAEGIFRDCLRVGYCCLVLERAERIIGHGIMSIAAGECHILNLCIHPDYHRRGLGRRLLRRLLALARQQDTDTAFLEVRASNRHALSLYSDEGFNEIGLRRGYYPAGEGRGQAREDAVVMARAL